MKKSVLQQKSVDELVAHAADLKAQIADKRFALRAGGDKQSHALGLLRKELAQTLTRIAQK